MKKITPTEAIAALLTIHRHVETCAAAMDEFKGAALGDDEVEPVWFDDILGKQVKASLDEAQDKLMLYVSTVNPAVSCDRPHGRQIVDEAIRTADRPIMAVTL